MTEDRLPEDFIQVLNSKETQMTSNSWKLVIQVLGRVLRDLAQN